MAYLEFFPDSLTMLREELLRNHQDLLEKMDMQAGLEKSLGQLAEELNIGCDGVYDLDDICKVLLVALKHRTKPVLDLSGITGVKS